MSRPVGLAAALCGVLLLADGGAALAQGTESYGVFCARGRVVVDSRSAEQMASGQGACQLGRFSSRTDAEGFARRNFGGVGGSCSCR